MEIFSDFISSFATYTIKHVDYLHIKDFTTTE